MQAGLRAKALRQTGHWLILVDCSNAFNFVKRAEVFEEVSRRVPALAPFLVKSFGGPAGIHRRLESRGCRRIHPTTGVHQGDTMGPDLFVMSAGVDITAYVYG